VSLRYRGPVGPFLLGLAGLLVAFCALVLTIAWAANAFMDAELRREIERAKAGLPAKEQGR